jgi:hypothetical protein
MAKKTEAVQVKVRMPKDLQRKIQRDADRHGQTINAEILKRIENSFQSDRMFEGILTPENAKFVRMIGQAAILAGDWRGSKARFEALEDAIVRILYAAALDLIKREREKYEKTKPTRQQLREEASKDGDIGIAIAQIVIANEMPEKSMNEVNHEHGRFHIQREERSKIYWGRSDKDPVSKLAAEITDKKGTTDD